MKLANVARVLRSKNAGPLAISIDIVFDCEEDYALAVASSALSRRAVAQAYGIDPGDIEVIPVPLAQAIKVTFPRSIVAGSPGDRDVYGAQQHRPLMDLEV